MFYFKNPLLFDLRVLPKTILKIQNCWFWKFLPNIFEKFTIVCSTNPFKNYFNFPQVLGLEVLANIVLKIHDSFQKLCSKFKIIGSGSPFQKYSKN